MTTVSLTRRQQDFLDFPEVEAYWTAGSGKTFALCYGAVQMCVSYPDASALLVVPKQVMIKFLRNMLAGLCGGDAVWSPVSQRFTFPNGSVLQLLTLVPGKTEDTHRLSGYIAQYIGVDLIDLYWAAEAADPTYRFTDYLLCRLRKQRHQEMPLRFRGAGT